LHVHAPPPSFSCYNYTTKFCLPSNPAVNPAVWLSEYFINHPHDLMHKACGWMLREAGKKNMDALSGFLAAFHKRLPRTTLRYSIERMTPAERKKWMEK